MTKDIEKFIGFYNLELDIMLKRFLESICKKLNNIVIKHKYIEKLEDKYKDSENILECSKKYVIFMEIFKDFLNVSYDDIGYRSCAKISKENLLKSLRNNKELYYFLKSLDCRSKKSCKSPRIIGKNKIYHYKYMKNTENIKIQKMNKIFVLKNTNIKINICVK